MITSLLCWRTGLTHSSLPTEHGVEDAPGLLSSLHMEFINGLFFRFQHSQPKLPLPSPSGSSKPITALVLRFKDFLQERPQHVLVHGFRSKSRFLNTPVPRDCVLFSIDTNNITSNICNVSLFEYADDMAQVAPIKEHTSLTASHQKIESPMRWIKESSLTSAFTCLTFSQRRCNGACSC